jgi:hypothetical protein
MCTLLGCADGFSEILFNFLVGLLFFIYKMFIRKCSCRCAYMFWNILNVVENIGKKLDNSLNAKLTLQTLFYFSFSGMRCLKYRILVHLHSSYFQSFINGRIWWIRFLISIKLVLTIKKKCWIFTTKKTVFLWHAAIEENSKFASGSLCYTRMPWCVTLFLTRSLCGFNWLRLKIQQQICIND